MKVRTQRLIYNSLMLAAPAIVTPPFLFFKRGRQQLGERFGFWDLKLDHSIWFHGASLGEMIGISHIARELKADFSNIPFLATATSPTGLPKALQFAQATRLLPFDHPLYFEKVIEAVSPKAFVFGETELWPNLLFALSKRNVPCYLVNGRISERTFKYYLVFKEIVSESLQSLSHIFASSEEAKNRFVALGADPSQISIVPNTKYDLPAGISIVNKKELTAKLFKKDLPVVVLSSLRPGEEEILFPALKSLQANYIIAPRHAEKFDYFEAKLREYEFRFQRRTKMQSPIGEEILLLDTIGELSSLIPCASLVFVGGTLKDHGGHNPLEAASFGIPPIVGPYHSTVNDVVAALRKAEGIFEVANQKQVEEILKLLLTAPEKLDRMGQNSQKVATSFEGGSKIIAVKIAEKIHGN